MFLHSVLTNCGFLQWKEHPKLGQKVTIVWGLNVSFHFKKSCLQDSIAFRKVHYFFGNNFFLLLPKEPLISVMNNGYRNFVFIFSGFLSVELFTVFSILKFSIC